MSEPEQITPITPEQIKAMKDEQAEVQRQIEEYAEYREVGKLLMASSGRPNEDAPAKRPANKSSEAAPPEQHTTPPSYAPVIRPEPPVYLINASEPE